LQKPGRWNSLQTLQYYRHASFKFKKAVASQIPEGCSLLHLRTRQQRQVTPRGSKLWQGSGQHEKDKHHKEVTGHRYQKTGAHLIISMIY
jgi:hypothetical protein